MAENENELIRVPDTEARAMLRQLAEMDLRAMGNEVAWIVRQEWARRFSQPEPLIMTHQVTDRDDPTQK